MEEILKDGLLEAVFDMDQFFPAGYVIELGKNRYYRKYQDGKILCSAIMGAKRFPPVRLDFLANSPCLFGKGIIMPFGKMACS